MTMRQVLLIFLTCIMSQCMMVASAQEANNLDREHEALMALYNSTDGENWKNHENWGSDKPLSQWYGVRVNENGNVYMIDLPDNNLTGTIPTEISLLEKLNYLELNLNNLSGDIPESIANIKDLIELNLGSNNFSGEIPSWFGELKNLVYLHLYYNQFTGAIPETIGDMEKLEMLLLDFNQLSGAIPSSLSDLKSIRQLGFMHNQLTGTIPEELGNLTTLTSLTVYDNHITGNLPASFVNLTSLESLNVGMNEMDGTIPEELTMSELWSNISHIIEQREGHELKIGKIYESTDYSKDGEVSLLQSHTKGNGIALVFTGTAYSDRKIADGLFTKDINLACERFFEAEPYKSFRQYFDVYCITTVSKNEGVGGTDTAYGMTYVEDQPGSYIYSFDIEALRQYLAKIKALQQNPKTVTLVLLVNDRHPLARGVCSYWDDDLTVAISDNSDDKTTTIQHEAGGHAFAKLADEYFVYWKDDSSTFPESSYESLDKSHGMGWHLNVDYHKDPSTVLWKDFLSNPDYEIENLGIYEGGLESYPYGIYRPSENSIMNDAPLASGYFNAPSRWAIYQWIMKLGGEECRFEDFLKYDKKNLQAMIPAMPGDANGNGNLDAEDVQAVVDYIMGKDSHGLVFKNADLNGDGKVDVTDIVMLVNMVKTP